MNWCVLLFVALGQICWSLQQCPPSSYFSSSDGRCYLYVATPQAFLTAEQTCSQYGGHLASMSNAFINSFVVGEASLYFGTIVVPDIWIGANNLNSDNTWKWTDGTSFTYTRWGANEPNQPTTNNCASLQTADGSWKAGNCYQPKSFVCALPTMTAPSNAPVTCPSQKPYCDSEWTFFSETLSCYKVQYGSKWAQAEAQCVVLNSHLASIHSDNENSFITDLTYTDENKQNNQLWIGLSYVNSQYVWSDGTPSDYYHWHKGEPSNPGKENCIELYSYSDAYSYWNDENCDENMRAFICKKAANTV